jgi:Na+-translocating ferredoxin:NAD+ oxidoreductase RnfD subunit
MKKFFGITLISLGALIALVLCLVMFINAIKGLAQTSNAIDLAAFLTGTLLAACVMGLIPFFMIRIGLKMLKKKPENDQVDKILSIK